MTKYFNNKINSNFFNKNDELILEQPFYAVLDTNPTLKIRNLDDIKQLYSNHFKEQKELGNVSADLNYLKYFNLNQKGIKQIGRVFHIDLLGDANKFSPNFFNN
jgi:hypothetical protein